MPPMNRRHEAFHHQNKVKPAFDPHPNELSLEEVEHVQGRAQAGQAPRMRLIHKMLRLCPKQKESEP